MGSDDLFEAVSHPLRIEIIKALAEKPKRFADIKRALKINSSGLLDFHLKKLDDLVTVEKGCYALTEKGFAALQAVETVSKYGWQRRSFYINLLICIFLSVFSLLVNLTVALVIVLPITVAWMLFYSYWTLVKRRIRLRK